MELIKSHALVAHLDMNSFFATVEQQANPLLRGRPLGVCAYLHERGCIIAASVEAKRMGMKVGMRVEEARKAVPTAAFVQNEPAKYRSVISRVFRLLHEVSDKVEHYSIDEAFIDLTGWCRDEAEAAWLMAKIQTRIQSEIGEWLKSSVGIAPNRLLAKLASDMKKPNGLTILYLQTLDEQLSELELEDICGIGRKTHRRLMRVGIHSILDLKHAQPELLLRVLGKYGYFLWSGLNGTEYERVNRYEKHLPKSIGHSYCVPNHVNEAGHVELVARRLLERAAKRLREAGLLARRISLVIGLRRDSMDEVQGWGRPHGVYCSDEIHLPEPASDCFTLQAALDELLSYLWSKREPVSFFAVTLFDLVPWSTQTTFESLEAVTVANPKRRSRISEAIDQIRDRYGPEALVMASMMKLGNEAPDRIGFRTVEGIEV